MIQVDPRSRTPIYEQLVENITRLVVSGDMPAQSSVPSVRVLAAELSVNPNTVQKAFTELERRGILYSAPGKGRFVCGDTDALRSMQAKKQLDTLASEIRRAISMGVSPKEILDLAKSMTGGSLDD